MAIDEVFPSAPVSQVIFQIRFPNLFYLESRMGDFQVRVMKDFPKSSLSTSRQFVIVEGQKMPAPGEQEEHVPGFEKIWNFESTTGVELHVKTDSLDLSSKVHKTYNNPKGAYRFRDSIQRAVDALLEVTKIPIATRIGLRYLDNCHVPEVSNDGYKTFYNTCLALDRFALPDAEELTHVARAKRGPHFVRVAEAYRHPTGQPPTLTLDFDAYATDIAATDYLAVTDQLHDLAVDEFQRFLKPPMYEFMRKGKT